VLRHIIQDKITREIPIVFPLLYIRWSSLPSQSRPSSAATPVLLLLIPLLLLLLLKPYVRIGIRFWPYRCHGNPVALPRPNDATLAGSSHSGHVATLPWSVKPPVTGQCTKACGHTAQPRPNNIRSVMTTTTNYRKDGPL
jgi:hypothetical protein